MLLGSRSFAPPHHPYFLMHTIIQVLPFFLPLTPPTETTDELDPLKGFTRLLTLGRDGRGLRANTQESYSLREEITGETPRELD